MSGFGPNLGCVNYALATAHEEMNSKRRNTMEDVYRIVPVLDSTDSKLKNWSYLGIYDGHGGRQIADFLETNLEETILQELKLQDDADVQERLTRAFLLTDMNAKKLGITTSGATAVSALLSTSVKNGISSKKLYVANVGDSRAVLVSSLVPGDTTVVPSEATGSASSYIGTRLSFDHRAEDEEEQQRIKEAGGFIARNRVLGILAVSRSFGDHGMKDFVIASPYCTETELTDCGHCPILILACDGVWDVLSDQDATDLLIDKYKKIGGPFEDAAKLLVTTAIDKGSADNVTAIVVFL